MVKQRMESLDPHESHPAKSNAQLFPRYSLLLAGLHPPQWESYPYVHQLELVEPEVPDDNGIE